MSQPTDIDVALIRKLAGLLDETHLTEIEYAWGEFRLRVARQANPALLAAPAPGHAAPPATAVETPPQGMDLSAHPGAVRSPMVGTAYLSAQPESPPFVQVGDSVAVGQTLVIIEAMKVMNQIRAPKAGKVSRILVENGGPVEFSQIIMLID